MMGKKKQLQAEITRKQYCFSHFLFDRQSILNSDPHYCPVPALSSIVTRFCFLKGMNIVPRTTGEIINRKTVLRSHLPTGLWGDGLLKKKKDCQYLTREGRNQDQCFFYQESVPQKNQRKIKVSKSVKQNRPEGKIRVSYPTATEIGTFK